MKSRSHVHVATGWFGRGKAGSTDSKFYEQQNAKFLTRKARKQIDRIESAFPSAQHLLSDEACMFPPPPNQAVALLSFRAPV